MVSLTGTAEELSSQKVAIVLQKGKIEIPEEFHMLVLYSQLLWRVPVDHLFENHKWESGEEASGIIRF